MGGNPLFDYFLHFFIQNVPWSRNLTQRMTIGNRRSRNLLFASLTQIQESGLPQYLQRRLNVLPESSDVMPVSRMFHDVAMFVRTVVAVNTFSNAVPRLFINPHGRVVLGIHR